MNSEFSARVHYSQRRRELRRAAASLCQLEARVRFARVGDETGDRSLRDVGFRIRRHGIERVPLLKRALIDRPEPSLNKADSTKASASKRQLVPRDGVMQNTFRCVIGGLCASTVLAKARSDRNATNPSSQ